MRIRKVQSLVFWSNSSDSDNGSSEYPPPHQSCWLDVAGYLLTIGFCFAGQKQLYPWGVGALTPEEMPLAGCADMMSKGKDFFLKIYFCF